MRFHLTQHHAVIDAPGIHQLFVTPPLDHSAILHQEDQIGAANRREAMAIMNVVRPASNVAIEA